MFRKVLIGLGLLVGLIGLGVGGLLVYAASAVGKTYDVPLPQITRATTPEALARGEQIFRTVCAECHAGAAETVAKGTLQTGLPPMLGKIYSANLTSHPEAGIGGWRDEEVARMILHAINREGKVRPMAAFRLMGDADVAAVIGFMRSGAPDFEPTPDKAPRSELTAVGNIVQVLVFGIHDKPRPATIAVPPKAPTEEYGRYMANAVYDCYFCHTGGMSGNKLNEPNLYAGGFEFEMKPLGGEGMLYSPNITPHPTAGIGQWSLEEFKRALRHGISKDSSIVRPPMPKYRYIDDVEAEAIFTYLKTVPVSDKSSRPSDMPRQKAEPSATPEQLFSSLGCEFCHGANRQFSGKLKNAVGKAPEDVAKWIRNPEAFKPGTQMPSYAELLNDGQALKLAEWVQQRPAP
jgi:mono/diheme cytochrome c family protein